MSLAENLLNSLDETAYQNSRIAGSGYEEAHIVVNADRSITVPPELQQIAVTGDKDVETVTFDCTRYWDGNDLSTFSIFLYYSLPDGVKGVFKPNAIYLSDDYYSFDWTIGSELTHREGTIAISLVARQTDADGNVLKQWGSFPNSEMKIVAGLFNPGMPDGGGGGSSGGSTIIALENVPVELNLSSGDQKFSSESGYLMKSVLIKKPNTLIPENIRYGVNIAGIIGAYKGASGGGDVNPPIHYEASNTATVEVGKVVNLSPSFDSSWDTTGTISATVNEVSNNGVVSIGAFRFGLYFECTGLKAGTAIVEVIGNVTETDGTTHNCKITYTITVTGAQTPTLGAPALSANGTKIYISAGAGDTPTSYAIYANGNEIATTTETTVDLSEKLDAGTYSVYVVACIDSFRSPASNTVSIRKATSVGTPTISINGDILTITAGAGDTPTSYAIYANGNEIATTTETTVDLSEKLDAGTYNIYVTACNSVYAETPASNTVSYTKSASGGDEPTDVLNFDQEIRITEGSNYRNPVYTDSGDWDTPIIDRIEVISNDGSVEVEGTTGSEWVSVSGSSVGHAIIKYHCHTHDNHAGEDVYFTVTYTIYVDSAALMNFYVDFYSGPDTDSDIERRGTYKFEDGMTWEAWVNSSYNNANAWFDEVDYENHLWFVDGSHYISVAKTDVIGSGQIYNALLY